jgi:hypothetical protein
MIGRGPVEVNLHPFTRADLPIFDRAARLAGEAA